jgi:hypothetical protein
MIFKEFNKKDEFVKANFREQEIGNLEKNF